MTDYQQTVEQSPDLAVARGVLAGFHTRTTTLPLKFRHELARLKTAAVAAGDANTAGAVWCLETIADAQDRYLSAWDAMREDRFYAAWCALEQSEIALHFLARHLDDSGNMFGVAFLRTYVPRWQSLFPYRVFLSPGFSKRSIHCSICDARLTPRRPCDHHLGELYDGVMCRRVIKEATMIEVSLVERPV